MYIGLLISETKNPDDAKRCTMGLIADEDWAAMQRDPLPVFEELDKMTGPEWEAYNASMAERDAKREDAFARLAAELALAAHALPAFPD